MIDHRERHRTAETRRKAMAGPWSLAAAPDAPLPPLTLTPESA